MLEEAWSTPHVTHSLEGNTMIFYRQNESFLSSVSVQHKSCELKKQTQHYDYISPPNCICAWELGEEITRFILHDCPRAFPWAHQSTQLEHNQFHPEMLILTFILMNNKYPCESEIEMAKALEAPLECGFLQDMLATHPWSVCLGQDCLSCLTVPRMWMKIC